LKPKVDGVDMNGVEASEYLRELGVILPMAGTSSPRKMLNWILQDNDYEWSIIYKSSKENLNTTNFDRLQDNISILPKEEEDNLSFPEGKEIFILHKTKERNQTVVELAKKLALEKDKNLCCQACDFSFAKVYGEIGQGFIEAHHTKPLSELSSETETKVQDLVLVCSNCHRMLHRRRPWLNINDIQNLIS
jgi:predicted HNH restriction endonuclease